VARIAHSRFTKNARETISGSQLHGRPALKLRPGQVPAFTAEDMKAYLQGAPECSLGPTLSGEPPTVESVEFASVKELRERLRVWIGQDDDALACFVVLRGPFHLMRISFPPGKVVYGIPWCNIVGEIYDAMTGSMLCASVNAFKSRPGWSVDRKMLVDATPRLRQSAQQSVSREQLLTLIETPDPFIAWLRRYTPDAEVASIFDPVHSMLAEYFWATLEVDTMYGDSIVWGDGAIEWNDLPAWVCSLNRAESRHAGAVPDNKGTWSASEILEMVDEATSSGSSCPARQPLAHGVGFGTTCRSVWDRVYLRLLLVFILSQLTQRR
jgi:hypothetical protein